MLDDEITPAQIKWQNQQMREIKTNIKNVLAKIDELNRQNKIEKISAIIINRNNEKINELEQELENLKEQQSQLRIAYEIIKKNGTSNN